MAETQPANISMYQDFLMKFAQQQQSPLQKNLLQSNPLLHQMQQQMQRERVNNERNSLGENSAESVSPVSSGAPATSRDLLNALAEQKLPTLLKQDSPKTPRRNDQKEQHKCPKCDYTTPWKSSIATHMKLKHSNERPWRCDICSKAYKLKHHLKAHMEGSHASEKPYQCKLCVFSCIDSRTLNKHMFNKHGRQNPLKHGQGMLGGAGGPMRGRVLPNMLPMSRPYDPTGFSNNPWARKDITGPLGRLPNHLAGLNPALMQNPMETNQMLNPLASDPAALMAQIQKNQEMFAAAQAQENALNNPMLTSNSMLLQLAASMQRQLQSRIQQQVQTSMSSPMPATSPLATPPFSAAQIPPPSPVTEAVVEEVNSNAGSTSDQQAPPQIVVKAELLPDESSPESPAAIVSTENNDINGNVEVPPPALTPRSTTSGQEVVVEPASPAVSGSNLQIADQTIATEASEAVETRSISVKSERLDDSACAKSTHSAHSNNSTNLRKRKLEDPGIGHMMSEQLLQQRLAQAARPSIPFPFGLSQFQARDRRPSGGSSDELSPPAARAALGAQMHASMSLQRQMQGGDFFNQLAQLQQLVGANQNAQMQPLRCEHCQITFPDPIMYMAHMDMHKNPAIHPFQCSRCSHICKDRTEFFLHWRNNECNN